MFGAAAPREVFPQAKAAVQKALELAPDLGEAHASLGHIFRQYDLDWDGAERAFRRAIALSPAFAAAHQWLGLSVALRGRFDEGISHMRRAQEPEPGTLVYSATIGMRWSMRPWSTVSIPCISRIRYGAARDRIGETRRPDSAAVTAAN